MFKTHGRPTRQLQLAMAAAHLTLNHFVCISLLRVTSQAPTHQPLDTVEMIQIARRYPVMHQIKYNRQITSL
jgi:hypothetical protein